VRYLFPARMERAACFESVYLIAGDISSQAAGSGERNSKDGK